MQWISSFLSGTSPFIYLFIFFGKLLEVSLASLRTQLIFKGQRLLGTVIAVFEYAFWLCITASALTGFQDDPIKILILIAAYALGQLLGSFIEEKLALGYCTISAIFMEQEAASCAAQNVRKNGQAVTVIPVEGIDNAPRTLLSITAKRKNIGPIQSILHAADPHVVITIQAMQQVKGATYAKTFK